MPIYIYQLVGDGDGLWWCLSCIVELHAILNSDVIMLIKVYINRKYTLFQTYICQNYLGLEVTILFLLYLFS